VNVRPSARRARSHDDVIAVVQRGREDLEFFWKVVLNRTPHPGQLEFHQNAEATINCLATANRWGKTTLLPAIHFHSQIYKVGAEQRYLSDDGCVDPDVFFKTKYRTIHTADEWELARLVWDEANKMINESSYLESMIKDRPRTKPPHIEFLFGGLWKFRTLGDNASGIDGDSYYLITIDEAGWIQDLGEKMDNVIRVRVADVRGRIVIVGTFKSGFSRDFRKFCLQAATQTGVEIGFDFREDVEKELVIGGLHPAIRSYARTAGIPIDDYLQAAAGG
jgi:hypothetical protein